MKNLIYVLTTIAIVVLNAAISNALEVNQYRYIKKNNQNKGVVVGNSIVPVEKPIPPIPPIRDNYYDINHKSTITYHSSSGNNSGKTYSIDNSDKPAEYRDPYKNHDYQIDEIYIDAGEFLNKD